MGEHLRQDGMGPFLSFIYEAVTLCVAVCFEISAIKAISFTRLAEGSICARLYIPRNMGGSVTATMPRRERNPPKSIAFSLALRE